MMSRCWRRPDIHLRQRRISGRLGHFVERSGLLGYWLRVNVSRLQHLVAAHLSEQNTSWRWSTANGHCVGTKEWIEGDGDSGLTGARFEPSKTLASETDRRSAGSLRWLNYLAGAGSGQAARSGGAAAGAAASAGGLQRQPGQQRCRRQQGSMGFSSRAGAAVGRGQQP